MRLWLRKRPKPEAATTSFFAREPFQFLDVPAPLVDGDLELVEPSARWIDPVLMTTTSFACIGDASASMTRTDLLKFLDQFPRGRQKPNAFRNHAPGYTYWMRIRTPGSPIEMAGTVSLRIGAEDPNLRFYLGHVGYGVYPPARGGHFGERATRLLFPLARAHGLKELWITTNPENEPSRRTCERLGGEMVDIVDLPVGHPLYERGERRKCRYRIGL